MVWCNQNSCMHVRNDFIFFHKRLPLHGTVPFLTKPSILTLNEVVLLLFQLVPLQLFAVRYCVDAIMFSAPQFINPHKHFYGLVFFFLLSILFTIRQAEEDHIGPTHITRKECAEELLMFHYLISLKVNMCEEVGGEWTWIMRTPFGCFWGFLVVIAQRKCMCVCRKCVWFLLFSELFNVGVG